MNRRRNVVLKQLLHDLYLEEAVACILIFISFYTQTFPLQSSSWGRGYNKSLVIRQSDSSYSI